MVSPAGQTGTVSVGEVLFTQGKALANPDGTTLSTHIEQVELSEQTYLPLIVQE